MRTTKFWVLLGLLMVVLMTSGFSLFSCKQDEYYMRPGAATMQPGQTQKFTVMYKTSSEPIGDSAIAEWWWEVSGPAASQAKRVDNSSAEWTAPSTPGVYTITARTIKENWDASGQITVEATKGAPQEMSQNRSAPTTPTGPPVKVLEVGNVYGIKAGAKAPSFTLTKPATLVQLLTYHYIAGGGPTPGTIGLRSSGGTVVGPFKASGLDAQGGVKNGFWVANTNTHLEPGTYTVVDSSRATWSTNSRAKGLGFTTVSVIYDK